MNSFIFVFLHYLKFFYNNHRKFNFNKSNLKKLRNKIEIINIVFLNP